MQHLLARLPDARIRDARFHALTSRLTLSLPTYRIVFTLDDGTERLEHFQCDLGGRLAGPVSIAYEEFCPKPEIG